MKRMAAWVAGILVVDQLTKWAVQSALPYGDSIPVWGEWIRLTHSRNTGAAFGLLAGGPAWLRQPLLIGVSLLVGFAIVGWGERCWAEGRLAGLGYAGIAGGALGNAADRIRLHYVVDFVDVGWVGGWRFWAFNVADSAITIGALLLIWSSWAEGRSGAPVERHAP